mmetsp:Transcript_2173/g.2632  ORF Transcript_2173/g.2632 Transcript_2173/m.2632 type:complete len:268 (+) Transcript_2173:35-838(+)
MKLRQLYVVLVFLLVLDDTVCRSPEGESKTQDENAAIAQLRTLAVLEGPNSTEEQIPTDNKVRRRRMKKNKSNKSPSPSSFPSPSPNMQTTVTPTSLPSFSPTEVPSSTPSLSLSLVPSSMPSSFPRLSQIALGAFFTCAVDTNNDGFCWGNNQYGQLAIGFESVNDVLIPTKIQFDGTILKMALGQYHGCLMDALSRVHCWGRNKFGQVGVGDSTQRNTPTLVDGISGVTDIVLGYHHSCALEDDGVVHCWGRNFYGQLGTGDTTD